MQARRRASSSSSSPVSIMKPLCLSLLLLAACCCDALPKGVKFSTAPQICCFSFKTSVTPLKFVSSVGRTHSSCPNKAFIVHTVKGRQICYSQTSKWAQDLYRLHNTEGRS